jgi:hypothetical protein
MVAIVFETMNHILPDLILFYGLAALVSNRAAGLASRLARGLALAAATLLQGFLKVSGV